MKKFLTIFFAIVVFFAAFSLYTKAEETTANKKWFNPKMLKTYIPPNHKRTIMMKHAFAEWSRLTNNKVVFQYVTSPNTANIIVHFVNVVPNADREIGLTKFRSTSSNKITHAQIYIAEKTASGQALGKDAVYTVMLHEIGHAIGIANHSKDPLSIMYPYEDDRQEILKSDLKTLADIYGW